MSDDAHFGDLQFRAGAVELASPEKGTRIRLSAALLGRLDWWEFKEGPGCWGVFRHPGELICAPKGLEGSDGRHPFAEILQIAAAIPENAVPRWGRIPSPRLITAPDRVIAFETAWTANQAQLSLKIGRDAAVRLGWVEENAPSVYASNWGRLLILMSRRFFQSTQNEELGV